jgi:DNA-binding CsgD family transcriptional regulator
MDKQVQTYDAFVSAIYDCAVDPALWPQAIGMIAQTYSGAYAGIHAIRMRPAYEFMGWYHSWHDDSMMKRLVEYVPDIPGVDEVANGPLDTPLATMRLVPFEQFSRTRFFREWADPQGLRDGCITKIGQADNRYVQLSFVTYGSYGDITDEQIAAIARLGPHLRRAAMIGDTIEQQRIMLAAQRDTLDRLACGVLLTDETRRVFHANQVAAKILDQGEIVRLRTERLVASQPERDRALGEALTKAHRGDTEVRRHGIGIPMHTPEGGPAVCYVLPLNQSDTRHVPGGPTVAVFLSVNSESFPIADAILSTLYGLTAAEARVASEIGKGGILRDIGQRLHVSENTLKTHLKRIFDKTGVRRQSDLVNLVASLVPPIQPPSPATDESGTPGR